MADQIILRHVTKKFTTKTLGDIVAVDEDVTTLVAECKWTNAPFGADQLAELDRRAHLAGANRTCPRWAFSKSGAHRFFCMAGTTPWKRN